MSSVSSFTRIDASRPKFLGANLISTSGVGKYTSARSGHSINKIPDSKYTDAVQDTSDGIRTNLNNQMLYAEKQQSINDNNETINKIIYDYELARDKVRVDEELYATSSIHKSGKTNGPKILKKRIMDNNDLYLSSKLLFTLGTLTASTLIVFAIILARD